MLEQLVTKLEELAKRAHGTQITPLPGLEQLGIRSIGEDGKDTFERVDLPAPRRAHTFESLSDMARFVKEPKRALNPEVFCSANSVQVLLDRDSRRDSVTASLPFASRFQLLVDMDERPAALEPKVAIQRIRFDLQGCGADDLVAALGDIDWTTTERVQTKNAHGDDGMGRRIDALVTTKKPIPETVTCVVKVWNARELDAIEATILCGVYIDTAAKKIVIRPLADEVPRAREAALFRMREVLGELFAPLPVFNGTPTLQPQFTGNGVSVEFPQNLLRAPLAAQFVHGGSDPTLTKRAPTA